MISTERTLEFDIIKDILGTFAYTKKAKQEIAELCPALSQSEVAKRQRETTEARLLIEKCGLPPATALEGIQKMIETAEKGGCLTPEQLEKVAITLTAVRRIKDYLNQGKIHQISLAYYEENLESLDDIYEEIQTKIRSGQVDDYASPILKKVRQNIEKLDVKMREKAESVLRANKTYMSEQFSTMRNGHICIPVKTEYKGKISGSVLDKSSTGSTVFIEPTAVGKIYSELEELRLDEENEEIRILYTLTVLLSDKAEIIHQNNTTIEKLDFMFAKAKLSLEQEGVQPRINTDRYISLKQARHPLMDKSISVPLNFEIGNGTSGVVITGPNTGGKTVAIKTVALNCMMAQSGLHIPCEDADVCMNNAIMCDIGDGQNLSENLSTFSAHITNVLDILKSVTNESLVIMDELGSGTDPAEGMGIAVAILEELKKSRALFLVTTHYPEVKEYAKGSIGITNARMTFDKESLQPLYQLVIGEAGESCAFYIAEKLGMPAHMLENAEKAAYGEKNIDLLVKESAAGQMIKKCSAPKIQKERKSFQQKEALKFKRGDSVMVLPDKKIGIVCRTADEKGNLQVQLPGRKIWISHKRIKLHVSAEQLYPDDYDFSIVFDSVEERKLRHDMERKYVEGVILHEK